MGNTTLSLPFHLPTNSAIKSFPWSKQYKLLDHHTPTSTFILHNIQTSKTFKIKHFSLPVNHPLLDQITHRNTTPSPYLLKIQKLQSFIQKSYCSQSQQIFIMYKYHQNNLKEEILNRKFKNNKFKIDEIMLILQAMVKAMKYLDEIKNIPKYINTEEILITKDRAILVNDPWLYQIGKGIDKQNQNNNNNNVQQHHQTFISFSFYPSPQQILFQNDLIPQYNSYYSILFTIGIIILQLIFLQPMDTLLYQKNNKKIYYHKVKQKIQEISLNHVEIGENQEKYNKKEQEKLEQLKDNLRRLLAHQPRLRETVYMKINKIKVDNEMYSKINQQHHNNPQKQQNLIKPNQQKLTPILTKNQSKQNIQLLFSSEDKFKQQQLKIYQNNQNNQNVNNYNSKSSFLNQLEKFNINSDSNNKMRVVSKYSKIHDYDKKNIVKQSQIIKSYANNMNNNNYSNNYSNNYHTKYHNLSPTKPTLSLNSQIPSKFTIPSSSLFPSCSSSNILTRHNNFISSNNNNNNNKILHNKQSYPTSSTTVSKYQNVIYNNTNKINIKNDQTIIKRSTSSNLLSKSLTKSKIQHVPVTSFNYMTRNQYVHENKLNYNESISKINNYISSPYSNYNNKPLSSYPSTMITGSYLYNNNNYNNNYNNYNYNFNNNYNPYNKQSSITPSSKQTIKIPIYNPSLSSENIVNMSYVPYTSNNYINNIQTKQKSVINLLKQQNQLQQQKQKQQQRYSNNNNTLKNSIKQQKQKKSIFYQLKYNNNNNNNQQQSQNKKKNQLSPQLSISHQPSYSDLNKFKQLTKHIQNKQINSYNIHNQINNNKNNNNDSQNNYIYSLTSISNNNNNNINNNIQNYQSNQLNNINNYNSNYKYKQVKSINYDDSSHNQQSFVIGHYKGGNLITPNINSIPNLKQYNSNISNNTNTNTNIINLQTNHNQNNILNSSPQNSFTLPPTISLKQLKYQQQKTSFGLNNLTGSKISYRYDDDLKSLSLEDDLIKEIRKYGVGNYMKNQDDGINRNQNSYVYKKIYNNNIHNINNINSNRSSINTSSNELNQNNQSRHLSFDLHKTSINNNNNNNNNNNINNNKSSLPISNLDQKSSSTYGTSQIPSSLLQTPQRLPIKARHNSTIRQVSQQSQSYLNNQSINHSYNQNNNNNNNNQVQMNNNIKNRSPDNNNNNYITIQQSQQSNNNNNNNYITITYQDNSKYHGQFNHQLNQKTGYGTLFYPDSQIAYQGQWLSDDFHGHGILFNPYPNPYHNPYISYQNLQQIDQYMAKYQGQFNHDQKQGYGKLIIQNGEIYIGEFKNDLINGKGKYYTKDGKVVTGTWEMGRLKEIQKNNNSL